MSKLKTYFAGMAPTGSVTVEELFQLRLPGKRVELMSGRLVVREPAGFLHGRVAATLCARLLVHAENKDLGAVFAAETGFVLRRAPDTVLAPDVAFISKQRLPETAPLEFSDIVPDLVVEVLSPNDRPGAVLAKVGHWLEAGVRLVWVVDPSHRRARVYRQDGSDSTLNETDALDGEDVVPGFSCDIESLL
jgi:Uma2 family endonuclease